MLNLFCSKSFILKYFFDKSTRKNRAEQRRPLWLTLHTVNCDVIITTDFYLLSRACVLSQKEIFINLQAKVIWKPGAIYDFLLRWACVQIYHMIIETTARSSGSLELRFIMNCDVMFEFSFLNIFKYLTIDH